MNRTTVRKFVAAGKFPERAQRQYRRGTNPFEDLLRERWEEGCHNAKRLFAELEQRGFKGSYDTAEDLLIGAIDNRRQQTGHRKSRPQPKRCPSSNRIAWLLLKPQQELTSKEDTLLKQLQEHCPTVAKGAALAQRFSDIVRQRCSEELDNWFAAVRSDGPLELRRFPKGLKDDLTAVRAALSLPWSNGQTEGQVNRLKMIKRQMFGRASFDLLRQRFLHPV